MKDDTLTATLRQAVVPAAALLIGMTALGWVEPLAAVALALTVGGGLAWAASHPRQIPGQTFTPPLAPTNVAAEVLDALPAPILLLDAQRRISSANEAAQAALGRDILRKDLAVVLRQPEALQAADLVLSGQVPHAKAEAAMTQPLRTHYAIQVRALPPFNPWGAKAIYALYDVTAVREAEKMRADFVANVSHELRSPLTAIIGFIETLQSSAKGDAEAQERFLRIMDDEAQRMRRLIGDLLSLSRIEETEHRRPVDPVDVEKIIKDVKNALLPRARKKGVEVRLTCGKGLEPIPGDKDQLTEVFHNLLDNAIKYGRDGAPIKIKAAMMDNMPGVRQRGLCVSIKDSGEGIALEHIPRLTERFYRVDQGRSRAMGGTGLGLAIVKHIVNRHRGRLVVDSTVGEGSTFTVYLPL
ncbi:MAG: hypothetical protein A2516_12240 [Alphaproteobacteria bacterium RIFOXYD12_FULL_60_8]|nr:MAG: hypothetical protein A2516_12240 [Alphaproteobacteria bacterium RIFOXYD12_FULL_60_8]